MTIGIVVLVWVIWARLPQPLPPLPATVALPAGETATAFTRGQGFLAVVTEGDEILIFDPSGRTLRQRIVITPGP